MPLDAICLRAVLHELRPQLIGARIDKVQQPARDQIVLLLRGNLRLLLNAGANQPRIQLTNILRDNPAQPPMFCMLLRKHLVGARVLSIEQPDLERMVILTLQCTDEFGEISRKQLVLECMGRRSNLVLLDAQGRIVECLRRVDADLSATRQLLPGLFYHLPTPLDKLSLLSQEEDSLALAQRGGDAEQAVDKWVLDHYTGISPLIAREFAFRAGHETDVRFGALNDTQRGALVQEFSDTANAVKEDNYMPVILYRDGKPVDFTYRPIAQYGAETQVETRESFSQMLDEFYDARERQELSARRGRELTHAVTVARDRMARKAENLKHDYAATQKRDEFRLRGDLITANLYRMKSGEKVLHAENYYEDGCLTIDIRSLTSRSTRCSPPSRTPRKTTSSTTSSRPPNSTCASRSKRRKTNARTWKASCRSFRRRRLSRNSTRSAANCRRRTISESRAAKRSSSAPSPRAHSKPRVGLRSSSAAATCRTTS